MNPFSEPVSAGVDVAVAAAPESIPAARRIGDGESVEGRRVWSVPGFTEFVTPMEVTAYSGRWDPLAE